MSDTGCPGVQELSAFLRGALDADTLERVADHVRGCTGCLERLQTLKDPTDPLVSALRQPAADKLFPADAAFWHAVLRLERTGPESGPAPPAAADRLVPGQCLGEYQLVERLGHGGMGSVWRALHRRLERPVALKVLASRQGHDPAAVSRFRREMKAVGKLRHANIVQATDAGEADGVPFLVMELVAGTDLARLVRRHGRLRPADACELVRQAALGLQHAHEQGLVHRDVKPSNLLLTPERQVKILDLGLALLKGEPPSGLAAGTGPTGLSGPALTSVSSVMGTNDYMAPEQWRDPHAVDARADLYSLGCTLFYLLAGRPPFDDGRSSSVLSKREAHLLVPPPALREFCPEAPPELEAVVRRLLAKDPADRYATAADTAEVLRPFAAGCDLAALLAPGPRDGPPDRGPTRTWPRLGLAGVVLLGTAALVWAALRGGLGAPARPPASDAARADGRPGPPPAGRPPLAEDAARDLQQRWAEYLGRPVLERNSLGMELALVPPGEVAFTRDYRAVVSRPYDLGVYEVTRGQFRAFVEATGYRTGAETSGRGGQLHVSPDRKNLRGPQFTWRTPGFTGVGDDQPVVQVTWDDAVAFCRWLSDREGRTYRLPTEAEWKWACRAGATTPFSYGSDPRELGHYAWHRRNSPTQPQPVGRLRPNRWGLYDMLGNVAEWTADRHGGYPLGTVTDPRGPEEGKYRVLCGGHYALDAFDCNTAGGVAPEVCTSFIGFRVCWEP
jgi:serine/threonine protein kinase/formylglycine-generating enzyme required for sulfatase activity